MFDFKILISNLLEVKQATIKELLWNLLEWRGKFFVTKKVDNRATVDTNIWSDVVPILSNNCCIDKVYSKQWS